MELNREYISITTVQEHRARPLQSYRVLGRRFAIFQEEHGAYYAIETNCKHQGADLLTGEIRDNIAICPRHQWQYDLRSGICLTHESPPLRRYAVIVVGDVLKMAVAPFDDTLDS